MREQFRSLVPKVLHEGIGNKIAMVRTDFVCMKCVVYALKFMLKRKSDYKCLNLTVKDM